MSEFRIGSVNAQHLQIGDHNYMVVHRSVADLAAEVEQHRAALADPSTVDQAVRDLSAELSNPVPRRDVLTRLIAVIEPNVAGVPAVARSLDAVRRTLGIG